MKDFYSDFKQAERILVHNPGVAGVAVLTLALGIGTLAGIFALVDGILFRSLPLPGRLFAVKSQSEGRLFATIPAAVLPLLEKHSGFEGVGFAEPLALAFRSEGGVEQKRGQSISADFLRLLEVRMAQGREFVNEEHRRRSAVMLLSHTFWKSHFGADPGVIGSQVPTENGIFEIVGILPPDFYFPEANNPPPDFLAPLNVSDYLSRQSRAVAWVGLREDRTIEAAQAELAALLDAFVEEQGGEPGEALTLVGARSALLGNFSQFSTFLLVAGGMLLLLCAANLVKLFLAHCGRRERELAIRAALGARRWDLVRQILIEGTLVSLVGAAIGLLLTLWLMAWLSTQPVRLISLIPTQPRLDLRVLAVALAAALGAGLLATAIPSIRFSSPRLSSLPGRSFCHRRQRGWFRSNALVIAEATCSTLLLVMAGLTLLTVLKLRTADLGFEAGNASVVFVSPPREKYSTMELSSFYGSLLDAVRRLPQVSFAAMGTTPMVGGAAYSSFALPGAAEPGRVLLATSDYFEALGLEILAGRGFTPAESFTGAPVAVINQAAARVLWPGEAAVGKSRQFEFSSRGQVRDEVREIVGVVADSRPNYRRDPTPSIYVPFDWASSTWSPGMIVRSSLDPGDLTPLIRGLAFTIDPWSITSVESVTYYLERGILREEFQMTLFLSLAALAMLLSTVGLYGVTSYAVGSRRFEFGVRMALGASGNRIVRLVLARTYVPLILGCATGIVLSFLLEGMVEGALFGVRFEVFRTIPLVVPVVALTGLFAGYRPARRASLVDPVQVLSKE